MHGIGRRSFLVAADSHFVVNAYAKMENSDIIEEVLAGWNTFIQTQPDETAEAAMDMKSYS